MSRSIKERYKNLILYIGIPFLCTLILFVFYFVIDYHFFPVEREITVEASHYTYNIDDFNKYNLNIKKITKINKDTFKKVGTKTLEFEVNHHTYKSKVHIIDTTAPVCKTCTKKIYTHHTLDIKDLYKDVKDASKVKVTYKLEPDLTVLGKQKVTLVLTDTYNNSSEYTTTITVLEDKKAPVIKGAKDLNLYIGKTISYKKGVTVEDNVDDDLQVEVDASKVNPTKAGDYKVTYTATDLSDNSTSQTITVHVKKYDINAKAEEEADKVLDKIIKDNMTDDDKVKTIYNYLVDNVKIYGYHYGSIDAYKTAAYYGFINKSGDCTTYASMFMVLLDEAGIHDYKLVRRYPINILNHYWLLINTGSGYYHYDPYHNTYKYTDTQLDKKGSKNRGFNYYQRNVDLYPKTPEV